MTAPQILAKTVTGTHAGDTGSDESAGLARSRFAGGAEFRYLSPAELVEHTIRRAEGHLSDSGALVVNTGAHTGRSPLDKFLVRNGPQDESIWWGNINQPMQPEAFAALHADIVEYLARGDRYRMEVSAGFADEFRLPVRLVTESPWSALFAHNLFLPPHLAADHHSDGWTILHAPTLQSDPERHQTRSSTAIALDFDWRRVLIAGTAYAGEIKKSIFTVMLRLLPEQGVAAMHCSANEGRAGDTALFFGLSGTGKTTLSTDPARRLIGDDEHGWSDRGIFNVEGGSYAKTIGLSPDAEPGIFRASQRFGSVLENVTLDGETREPRFADDSLTENTRAAFPLGFLDPDAGGEGAHPSRVLFLSADAFGVLPPAARLTRDQALYWFLSGYTSKLAGTERGVTSPSATFSACFAEPFLPLPPSRYADLLGERLDRHGSSVWLVNTGWAGGPYGVGERMPIALTRSVVSAILDGSLDAAEFDVDPIFGFAVPRAIPGVPEPFLNPRQGWADEVAYDTTARQLAGDFRQNFAAHESAVSRKVRAVGPDGTR